jgi:DNA-binding MarR family transcriptional regulator
VAIERCRSFLDELLRGRERFAGRGVVMRNALSPVEMDAPKRRGIASPVQRSPRDLGRVLEFMRLLWALDHALQKTSKRMAATMGITGPQRLVLRIVARFPGISAGQLASILHVDPSTLTGVLGRLEHAGMIRRRPDRQDGRRALFRLTAKGRRLDGTMRRTVESAVRTVLDQVAHTELDAAKSVLRKLTESLERAGRTR